MSKPNYAKQIEWVMENFNFKRVHHCMADLKWGWADCGGKTPDIEAMKREARHLLTEVAENSSYYSSGSGGFVARKWKYELTLSFEVAAAHGLGY